MSLDEKSPGKDEAPERVSRRNSIEYYHDKKDRVFVRPIQGHYGLNDELKRLRSLPRVRKAKDLKFIDGPQAYSRHYVEPKDGITQLFHIHVEEYGPGGSSQQHGHVNEAAFYILDGKGYAIHDGVRYDWKAGADAGRRRLHAARGGRQLQPSRGRLLMAWGEAKAWLTGNTSGPLYQNLLD